MSALTVENISVVTGEVEPVDPILGGLQAQYGPDNLVENYSARLRKDYSGPAGQKVRCGGALVVSVTYEREGQVVADSFEIDDNNRPFDELLITRLGALAEANWHNNTWYRDCGA